jgi:hypothetical protein
MGDPINAVTHPFRNAGVGMFAEKIGINCATYNCSKATSIYFPNMDRPTLYYVNTSLGIV